MVELFGVWTVEQETIGLTASSDDDSLKSVGFNPTMVMSTIAVMLEETCGE